MAAIAGLTREGGWGGGWGVRGGGGEGRGGIATLHMRRGKYASGIFIET